MSDFRHLLIRGPQHLTRNAELIRAWRKTGDGAALTSEHVQALLDDLKKQGFIRAEDARGLA